MCGIAGFVAIDGLDQDASSRALRMRDVITHRGPDEAGLHVDGYAALAHRRLSIVDLSSGQQPLSNEDGSIWVIFNGEIYNHGDVRRELEAHGHAYRTRSDTETIVHAYEQWGEDCVHRFRGMFAFAIWDAPKRRLLLVRDRLGIKPLYWTLAGGTLLFGSEIKAILASGLIEPRANQAVLPDVLSTRYTSGEDTMFRGIHKLLPGHLLVFENGTITKQQYWDVPRRGAQVRRPRAPGRTGTDVAAQMREQVAGTEAVPAAPAVGPARKPEAASELDAKIKIQIRGCDPLYLHSILAELVAKEHFVRQRRVREIPCVGVCLVQVADAREEPPGLDAESLRQAERLQVRLLDADAAFRRDRRDQRAAEQMIDIGAEYEF